jgi:hypothetical protein
MIMTMTVLIMMMMMMMMMMLRAPPQRQVLDVSPRGGRLVVFPSREVLHEVRPTSVTRWALSIWILGRRDMGEEAAQ